MEKKKRIDLDKCSLTRVNYPIGILLNDWKEQLLIHGETVFTISAVDGRWDLTMTDLLEIMKSQSFIRPYAT